MWTGQKLACLSACLSDAPGVGWGWVWVFGRDRLEDKKKGRCSICSCRSGCTKKNNGLLAGTVCRNEPLRQPGGELLTLLSVECIKKFKPKTALS